MKDVKESVLNKIKCGEVTMRPRWHFVLFSAMAVVGSLILVTWLVYLESFIFFVMSGTGIAYVPLFGIKGMLVFLLSAPWLLVALTVLFIVGIHHLVKTYAFCYTRPLIYSFLAIIGFTAVVAYILAQTDMHYKAMERAQDSRLPVVGSMYRQYGLNPNKDVHVGVVSSTTREGFIIQSRVGGEYSVIISRTTKRPPEPIQLGETVLILGPDEAGTIEAHGVKPFAARKIEHREQLRPARQPQLQY